MAHVSTDVIHDGWQGTRKFGKKVPEFTVKFIVKVDDQADGPDFILKECNLPKPGDKYKNIGNDDFGFAICKSVSVSPIGSKAWRADVRYAAPIFAEGEDGGSSEVMFDEDGDPTDDPELEGPEVSISLVQMTRPATSGGFLHKWNKALGGATDRTSWPGGPIAGIKPSVDNAFPDAITNSANVPFDPPPEIDYSRVAITISRNHKGFNGNALIGYQDTLNNDVVKLKFGAAGRRFKYTIDPYAGKMQSISCTRRHDSAGDFYWRVSFEIHVDNVFGWHPAILDRGYGHTAAWDPIKKTWRSAGEVATSTADPATVPAAVPIVTPQGHTANEPALLNGNGIPLGHGKDPVFITYQVYETKNWTPLKLSSRGWLGP